jgi:hypothetical protein
VWRDTLAEWPGPLTLPERPAPALPTQRRVDPGRPVGDALGGLVQFVLDSQPGQRNDRLNWAGYRAREHLRSGRYPAAEIVDSLAAAGLAVGLPEAEVARTLSSGLGLTR